MNKLDVVSILDLGAERLRRILETGLSLKAAGPSAGPRPLEGKSIALLFQKPSLRTRVSFDLAVHQMGGHPIYLSPDEVGIGRREPVEDVARVLGRLVDGIVARTFGHDVVEALARYARVPVINGLFRRGASLPGRRRSADRAGEEGRRRWAHHRLRGRWQ